MLDQYNKTESPFKVPENYFEDFNANIMSKLPEKKAVKVVPLWKKIVPWTAVAAVVAGVLFTVNTFQNDTTNDMVAQQTEVESTTASIAMTNITEDDYYAFLEEETNSDYYMDVFYGDEF